MKGGMAGLALCNVGTSAVHIYLGACALGLRALVPTVAPLFAWQGALTGTGARGKGVSIDARGPRYGLVALTRP